MKALLSMLFELALIGLFALAVGRIIMFLLVQYGQ
jgi:hypothetical protein